MSSLNKDKGRIRGRFFPMLFSTMEAPAWIELSHGAKALYLVLKRRLPGGNKAYISTRNAAHELKVSRTKVREWFAELRHYGFIVLDSPHCLGVDGVGKAPHWRLTELGATSKTNPSGVFEPPPQDFLKWDGTPFDPKPYRSDTNWGAGKIKPQPSRQDHPGPHVRTTPGSASYPPNSESGPRGVAIEPNGSGPHGVAITRLTTRGAVTTPTAGPKDPRVIALDATEARRRQSGKRN
jgi:hypothetical protein